MLLPEIKRVPQVRLQANLFDDDDDVSASSATPGPGEDLVPASASSEAPAADQVVTRCLDPDDPDASLETMTDQELLRHVDELRASADKRGGVIIRRLKAIVLLRQRGALAGPRAGLDLAAAALPAAKAGGVAARRGRFHRLLRRVTVDAGPRALEALAEWLADDLYDASSVGDFRRISKAMSNGVLTRELVSAAYRRAKRPGIRNPSACFRRFLWERWPGAVAQSRAGRR